MGNQESIKVQDTKPEVTKQTRKAFEDPILSLKNAIILHQHASVNTPLLLQIITKEQVQELKSQFQSYDKEFLDKYTPHKEAPLLDKLRRTIWKLMLIMPSLQNLPQQDYLNHYGRNQTSKLRKKDQQAIERDVCRTFPESHTLNRQMLRHLMEVLYGYVFRPLGYYSGETLILGFLLECGFSYFQAYYLYISLKVNKKYQLVRKITQDQVPEDTLAYKLGLSFAQQLSRKYPTLSTLISSFPVQTQLMCISDFICVGCNWDYSQIGAVALLWDFMICHCGHIWPIVSIQTQLIKCWYDQARRDQLLNQTTIAGNAKIEELFSHWVQFHKKITPEHINRCIRKTREDFKNQRAISLLDDFKLINPLYLKIYEHPENEQVYLDYICGNIPRCKLITMLVQDILPVAQEQLTNQSP